MKTNFIVAAIFCTLVTLLMLTALGCAMADPWGNYSNSAFSPTNRPTCPST